jgi:phosphomecalonate degydratase small subunit
MVDGRAEGVGLVSSLAFTFAHGVNPVTGEVTDVRSDIRGASVRARVLFYPFGKGSTTASSWFLEAVRLGNGPAAVVTDGVDLAAVIGSVLSRLIYAKSIPVVSGLRHAELAATFSGRLVTVDGGTGEVSVLQ